MRVGIDTGGTFTDLVLLDDDGRTERLQVPSTPDDPARALLDGLREVLAARGGRPAAVAHGTTVATNALLEGRFQSLALVTTRRFRHLLEIARQSVPSGYGNSYFWVKPECIVPLERVFEVTERLDFGGRVLTPLDEAEARSVARRLRELGIDTVGVSRRVGRARLRRGRSRGARRAAAAAGAGAAVLRPRTGLRGDAYTRHVTRQRWHLGLSRSAGRARSDTL